jgi:hypothetical protein
MLTRHRESPRTRGLRRFVGSHWRLTDAGALVAPDGDRGRGIHRHAADLAAPYTFVHPDQDLAYTSTALRGIPYQPGYWLSTDVVSVRRYPPAGA